MNFREILQTLMNLGAFLNLPINRLTVESTGFLYLAPKSTSVLIIILRSGFSNPLTANTISFYDNYIS